MVEFTVLKGLDCFYFHRKDGVFVHLSMQYTNIGLVTQANEYRSRCLSPGPILALLFFIAMQEVSSGKIKVVATI